MEHLDADQLVVMALGERAGDGDDRTSRTQSPGEPSRSHLQECALCRRELTQLTHTVELARAAGEIARGPVVLPASIWHGIAADLGIGAQFGSASAAHSPTPAIVGSAADEPTTDESLHRRPAAPDDDDDDLRHSADRPAVGRGSAVGHRSAVGRGSAVGHRAAVGRGSAVGRRADGSRPDPRRRWVRAVLIAAVVVAVGAGAAAGFAIGDRTASTAATVRYEADLRAMPAGPVDAHATATVTQTDGTQTLTVAAHQLPLRQGYYEVWLYNPTADKMVAVGTLPGTGRGAFTLASTIDLRSYNVVDVSAQDFDGNPAHKDSVLQGPLTQ